MTTLGWFFIIAGVVWLLIAVAVVAIFHTDAANDEAWEAERSCPRHPYWSGMSDSCAFCRHDVDTDGPSDLADDTTPTFTARRDEQGLGPIFEAGYRRQAKRLAAELDDATAVDRWLGGGSR